VRRGGESMLKSASRRKETFIVAISYLIGIAIIIILLHYVGIGRIIKTMMQMSIQFFILAFILDLAGLTLYALTWHILLIGADDVRIKFSTSLSVSLASIFACFISPSGAILEILRIILINREGGISVGKGAATVVIHRIIYTLSFIFVAITSYTVVQVKYSVLGSMEEIFIVIVLAAVFFIAGIYYISRRSDLIENLVLKLYDKYQDKLEGLLRKYGTINVKDTVSNTLKDFKSTFTSLKMKPVHLFLAFTLTFTVWITNILIFYLVFLSLNHPISIWIIALIMSIGEFVQMTPIMIPGMLGIIETVFTTALMSFGVPIEMAATASILARIATFWFDIPVTLIAASYYGVKYLVRGLARNN